MSIAAFVFPNQLFFEHPSLQSTKPDYVILIEDDLYFGDRHHPLEFHQQKLLLHLASMAYYKDLLEKRGLSVKTIRHQAERSALRAAFSLVSELGVSHIKTVEPADFLLAKRLDNLASETGITLELIPHPGFINTPEENREYRKGKKRWFMADFYQWQRRRLNILIDNGKPQGGQWSYDADNRKKIPLKQISAIPQLSFADESSYHRCAADRVKNEFSHCPGEVNQIIYPVTHQQAEYWLEEFLSLRFAQFGPYEDAIVAEQIWLYHSILTPALNTGLLTPTQVIRRTLEYAQEVDVPLSSLEGFIRQIIGWREFMRATYDDLGVTMRNGNHWQHHRKIPASFWQGTTGVEPVDDVIRKILKTGYCHHIERLMILGGFFFLCEFEPNEVYRWFMALFIDSYDWVMVPNVYAMSQNADGGLITTKPYFSGSNYVLKMSHYKKPSTKTNRTATNKDTHWTQIWDGLYWRWIFKHHASLARNPRWAMMCRQAAKMDNNKKATHLNVAEQFLNSLN